MKIFNRTRAGNDERRIKELQELGFEILQGHNAPPSPRIQARLSGRPVPPLVSTCYIELLREGKYWTLAIDGVEILKGASRADCLFLLELITLPKEEENNP